jgi:tRNA dimethylallyltransferase
MKSKKLLVILGPTSSGKSALAVKLAKKFKGEIISADSRQVYKGLDIATNKITPKEMRGVPHHLMSIVSPKKRFSVADFKELADKKITNITSRGKITILAGGTGFYIEAVVDGVLPPEVPPNDKLRNILSKKTLKELRNILKNLDSERFSTVQKENPRRLIRAIEISTALGKVPKRKPNSRYDSLIIGLNPSKEKLRVSIEKGVKNRIRRGMVAEAKRLHKNGLSWKRMRELGLGTAIVANYLQGHSNIRANVRMSDEEEENLISEIVVAEWKYAKRQMTWFKRDERIKWFSPDEVANINKKVRQFLDG